MSEIEYQKNIKHEENIVLKEAELNGKKIAFSSETDFLVQVRSAKGRYVTRYSFRGNLSQAVFYYNCINIGLGCAKRLMMPSSKKPVLAKQMS